MYKYRDQIINDIGENRYKHSLRVMELAEKLAIKYGVDVEQAKKAAYFHDCAKLKDKSEILKKAENFDIIDNMILKENIELIHGPLGAKLSKERYGIQDEEILNAIKYHTTGRMDMTWLDKIIYLADYAEPMRNFPGVENVRELIYEDLDKAMIKAMDQTIVFLIDKNQLISEDTINCRNQLLKNKS